MVENQRGQYIFLKSNVITGMQAEAKFHVLRNLYEQQNK